MQAKLIIILFLILTLGFNAPSVFAQAHKVVFMSDHEAKREIEDVYQDEYGAIYLYDPAKGEDLIRITGFGGYKRTPVWSPSGDKIAYTSCINGFENERKIYITDEKGSFHKKIPGNYALSDSKIAWSPDGTEIAFAGKNDWVCTIKLATGEVQRIFQFVLKITSPYHHGPQDISWSPDGKHLAFMVREGADTNDADSWILYVVSVEDKSLEKVSTCDDNRGLAGSFDWSPQGNKIYFMTFEVDDNNKRHNIRSGVYNLQDKTWKTAEQDAPEVRQNFHPYIVKPSTAIKEWERIRQRKHP